MKSLTIAAVLLFAGAQACSDYGPTISTPDAYFYKNTGVDTSGKSVRFRVKACHDAHVGLHSTPDTGSNTYEIVLGGWLNTKSAFRESKQGPDKVTYSTGFFGSKIVDCNNFRDFWINWGSNSVSVGTGNNVGSGTFLRYTSQNIYPINHVSVSTGWGATGQWQMIDCDTSCNAYSNMYTGILYDYQRAMEVSKVNSAQFAVKACHDAHVALSATTSTEYDTNEIVIGGWINTKSAIRDRKQGPELKEYRQKSVVDCKNFRDFWIMWENKNYIAIGQGKNMGSGEMMRVSTSHDINYMHFSTGWLASGEWIYDECEAEGTTTTSTTAAATTTTTTEATTTRGAEPTRPAKCNLPHDSGSGSGKNIRYYFTEGEQCKKFIYKGSGGNGNRFNSKSDCVSTCKYF